MLLLLMMVINVLKPTWLTFHLYRACSLWQFVSNTPAVDFFVRYKFFHGYVCTTYIEYFLLIQAHISLASVVVYSCVNMSHCLIILQLVNREMFWVVSEICGESHPVRRMKIVKQFIKVASKFAVAFLCFSFFFFYFECLCSTDPLNGNTTSCTSCLPRNHIANFFQLNWGRKAHLIAKKVKL